MDKGNIISTREKLGALIKRFMKYMDEQKNTIFEISQLVNEGRKTLSDKSKPDSKNLWILSSISKHLDSSLEYLLSILSMSALGGWSENFKNLRTIPIHKDSHTMKR